MTAQRRPYGPQDSIAALGGTHCQTTLHFPVYTIALWPNAVLSP
jgi:hypothetical protein